MTLNETLQRAEERTQRRPSKPCSRVSQQLANSAGARSQTGFNDVYIQEVDFSRHLNDYDINCQIFSVHFKQFLIFRATAGLQTRPDFVGMGLLTNNNPLYEARTIRVNFQTSNFSRRVYLCALCFSQNKIHLFT
jgi:hypothetical protein